MAGGGALGAAAGGGGGVAVLRRRRGVLIHGALHGRVGGQWPGRSLHAVADGVGML